MAFRFHEGEYAVQERAGVRSLSERVKNGIHSTIPDAAKEFLLRQPFAILGGLDAQGRVWASPIWGPAGFLQATDDKTVHMASALASDDPLYEALSAVKDRPEPVGILVIEPATRRRMRLNGTARTLADGSLEVKANQVYANCPKFIQKRTVVADNIPPVSEHPMHSARNLDEAQKKRIMQSDTFFIATAHPVGGADASHRGGNPGFVHISDEGATLLWPDYPGNAMFNTLGNLAANPSAGLLFLDFERGGALQLTGKAEILWGQDGERAVSFHIDEIIDRPKASPLRYRFLEYSPFNP